MLARSARGVSSSTGSVCLPTGTDSPVRADSLACNLAASSRRASAVTTSPLSRMRMSPGTNASASISWAEPPRRTRARTSPISCNASIERTARSSVKKPIEALIRTTAMMAKPSMISPKAKERAAAATRRSTTTLLNCSSKICQTLRLSLSRRRLRPNLSRRLVAASSSRPRVGSTSRRSASSCGSEDQGCRGREISVMCSQLHDCRRA